MKPLDRTFFARDTLDVARDLLGKHLVRIWNGETLVGRITETEAYIGRCDKACHAEPLGPRLSLPRLAPHTST